MPGTPRAGLEPTTTHRSPLGGGVRAAHHPASGTAAAGGVERRGKRSALLALRRPQAGKPTTSGPTWIRSEAPMPPQTIRPAKWNSKSGERQRVVSGKVGKYG